MAALAFTQVPTFDVSVFPDNGLPYSPDSDSPYSHGPEIQGYVDLPILASETPHHPYPADPLHARHNDIFHFLPNFIQVARCLNNDPCNRAFLVAVDSTGPRLLGIGRDTCNKIEFLRDVEPGDVLVRAPVEFEDDSGLPLNGGRGYFAEALHRVELLLQPIGDLPLYLQGGRSAILCLNSNFRAVHRGDHLHREAKKGDGAEEESQKNPYPHRDRIANTKLDQPHRDLGATPRSPWFTFRTFAPSLRDSFPKITTSWPALRVP